MSGRFTADALDRLYGLLLYAYPHAFRTSFGVEMRQTFRDRWRALSALPGRSPRALFLLQTFKDWIVSATFERIDEMKLELSSSFTKARLWRGAKGFATALGVLIVGLAASATFMRAYVISAPSMEGSLKVGDHILVSLTGSTTPIQPGELITFRFPEDHRQIFVKRVIGVPGDRIRIDGQQVIRNNEPISEPYALFTGSSANRISFPSGYAATRLSERGREMIERDQVGGEIVVPAGSYFVLGDNRDNSLDSRHWGFVPREDVTGRPMLVYWSYDSGSTQAPSGGLPEHFFVGTRWNRTLHLLR